MKLDRNINPNGRGKYAVINRRKLDDFDNEQIDRKAGERTLAITLPGDAVDIGDKADSEFFLIRLKDKYAGPALRAYEQAARADDPEYADEIGQLALTAETHPSKKTPSHL